MSCDKLVFDLSQEVEGSPNVFIRKDWLNILDNQNMNYQNNQSIIDTSQLANSNKYMSYREAYLAVPMVLSMTYTKPTTANVVASTTVNPSDYSMGLKNWFGQIIHSMTLDYNGTTIVQQTPFCNMWNTFKLLTTLSWNDVATQGATIGFYPDTGDSFGYFSADKANENGSQICNNDLGTSDSCPIWNAQSYRQWTAQPYGVGGAANATPIVPTGGNYGFTQRIKWITFDLTAGSNAGAMTGQNALASAPNANEIPYSGYANSAYLNQIWRSNIFNRIPFISNAATPPAITSTPVLQIAIMGTIYLKHIHSFFNMCPLLKGVFMKLTLNLNNSSCKIALPKVDTDKTYTTYAAIANPSATSSSYVGGVLPIMVSSINTGMNWLTGIKASNGGADEISATTLNYDLMVGSKVYNNDILTNGGKAEADNISKSVYLYVPAYTFNPTFEQAYLSNNIKQIKYTDIYQYQVVNQIDAGSQFNNLITNGIANIKSVLIIPFYQKCNKDAANIDDGAAYSEFLSPFETAGCGTTAPLVPLGNFNVQISGQNAIYNMQRYSFEEWNNQLYGQNAVNGGLTDGLTSGLINFADFQSSYGYYYVNVERMLPVEQSVPKSVQILGTNYSKKAINLWVFIEYGVQVSIDVLTGARV